MHGYIRSKLNSTTTTIQLSLADPRSPTRYSLENAINRFANLILGAVKAGDNGEARLLELSQTWSRLFPNLKSRIKETYEALSSKYAGPWTWAPVWEFEDNEPAMALNGDTDATDAGQQAQDQEQARDTTRPTLSNAELEELRALRAYKQEMEAVQAAREKARANMSGLRPPAHQANDGHPDNTRTGDGVGAGRAPGLGDHDTATRKRSANDDLDAMERATQKARIAIIQDQIKPYIRDEERMKLERRVRNAASKARSSKEIVLDSAPASDVHIQGTSLYMLASERYNTLLSTRCAINTANHAAHQSLATADLELYILRASRWYEGAGVIARSLLLYSLCLVLEHDDETPYDASFLPHVQRLMLGGDYLEFVRTSLLPHVEREASLAGYHVATQHTALNPVPVPSLLGPGPHPTNTPLPAPPKAPLSQRLQLNPTPVPGPSNNTSHVQTVKRGPNVNNGDPIHLCEICGESGPHVLSHMPTCPGLTSGTDHLGNPLTTFKVQRPYAARQNGVYFLRPATGGPEKAVIINLDRIHDEARDTYVARVKATIDPSLHRQYDDKAKGTQHTSQGARKH